MAVSRGGWLKVYWIYILFLLSNMPVASQAEMAFLEKLTFSSFMGSDSFGRSVSISQDGHTVIIGATRALVDPGGYVGAAYVYVRSGVSWTLQQKFSSSDGFSNDKFGSSVSISGDGNTAIVSAPDADWSGAYNDRGAAYIYVRNGTTWTEQQKLTASDGADQDHFGDSTAISFDGDTVIIGAVNVEDEGGPHTKGAAYVFVRNGTGWSEQQRLMSSGGAANNSEAFGKSVALSNDGNTAIVGAYNALVNLHSSQGAAYIFIRNGSIWTQQQQISSSDGAMNDWFGSSVSLSNDGNTAIVGAILADVDAKINQGAAYVFTRTNTTWSQQQKLISTDGSENNMFGISTTLSGDGNKAIVGAHNAQIGDNTAQGAAYEYSRSDTDWTEQIKLFAEDGAADDLFGFSTAISGDGQTSIIGSQYADIGDAVNVGAAYVYIEASIDSDNDGVPDYQDDNPDNPAVATPLTSTGTGKITVDTSSNIGTTLSDCYTISDADPIINQDGKPLGYAFLDGLVSFKVNGLSIGESIEVTLTFPTEIPQGSQYYKVNANGFYDFSEAIIAGNTVLLTLTDGGIGDHDNSANGEIIDPGGVAILSLGVDIADAIIAMQVISGLQPPNIGSWSDVNADNKLGLEEVIHILQTLSILRQ